MNALMHTNRFAKLPVLLAAALMVISLSGCNTITDVLGISPARGTLNLTITGPQGAQVSATVSGGDEGPQTFTDDGRGFTKALALRPGKYPITASDVSGYIAQIAIKQASGNSTRDGSYTVPVESGGVTTVSITYRVSP
jgi:hypothetical protein